MRIHLKGKGTPIPDIALPDLNIFFDLEPLVFNLPNGVPFLKADYVGLGYTNYEVWCIGGAGGNGGITDFDTGGVHTGIRVWSHGGAGGGGGLHVARGLLSDLPEVCPVIVGQAGTNGADGIPSYGAYGGSDGHGTLDPGDPGTDGGASSFNGSLCRASGGKGGSSSPVTLDNYERYIARNLNIDIPPGGNGGQGGKGDRISVGGGAAGGTGIPGVWTGFDGSLANTSWTTIDAVNGIWDGSIGEGGGGGHGGTFSKHYDRTMYGG